MCRSFTSCVTLSKRYFSEPKHPWTVLGMQEMFSKCPILLCVGRHTLEQHKSGDLPLSHHRHSGVETNCNQWGKLRLKLVFMSPLEGLPSMSGRKTSGRWLKHKTSSSREYPRSVISAAKQNHPVLQSSCLASPKSPPLIDLQGHKLGASIPSVVLRQEHAGVGGGGGPGDFSPLCNSFEKQSPSFPEAPSRRPSCTIGQTTRFRRIRIDSEST